MDSIQPAGIQLHLVTGRKHMFYQEDPTLLDKICNDLDGRIFSRASLILDGLDDVTAFPGHALIGITILTDPLPESFHEREKIAKTIVTQISQETFQYKRLQFITKTEGRRGANLSELEFSSGERLYLEFNEIATSGDAERSALNNLFAHPSLSCRRLDCGFSIWNTAHIVSWSHYPKLEVPVNAWPAELLREPALVDAKITSML